MSVPVIGFARTRAIEEKTSPTAMPRIATSDSGLKGERPALPIFANTAIVICMGTMNISLPDHLKSFVDEQVAGRGYGTSSEYIRELIRRDQDRLALRRLLLDGASSAPTEPVGAEYFTTLRDRVRGQRIK
ncbi:antitoxin ParD1/3/4 [Sinorhizobium fredii]